MTWKLVSDVLIFTTRYALKCPRHSIKDELYWATPPDTLGVFPMESVAVETVSQLTDVKSLNSPLSLFFSSLTLSLWFLTDFLIAEACCDFMKSI